MASGREFHRNVFLLTQAVPPSKDFQKHFKEGMFDRSNSMGFIHVSHYLLMIYDEERFKKVIEWPILDRRSEDKYRNGAKDFMTVIFKENEEFECPNIQKSHLVAPQGRIIINIMRSLSQIVLRTYLRRVGVHVLDAPKPQYSHPLTKLFFNNTIAMHVKVVKELDENFTEIENKAKEQAEKTAEEIQKAQTEQFEASERLTKVAAKADIHSDVKKRISDCSDTEVIQLWIDHIKTGTKYLEQKQIRMKEIEEQSTKVNNLVLSLFSDARKILDGKSLPKINTAKLMELPLDPEAQVALHHLYMNNNLVLNNMFIVCESMLRHYRGHLEKHGFPDVSECNEQIKVSMEDLQEMCIIMNSQKTKITQLLSDLRSQHQTPRRHINPEAFRPDNYDILESMLLKASPKTTINVLDYDPVNTDIQERLKLTPVEGQHRALFTRHKNYKEAGPSETPSRPKITVSRINFDDTLMSTSSSKLGAIPKRMTPTDSSKLNQSSVEALVGGKFARLFSVGQGSNLNSSMTPTNSGKALSSTVIEGHNSGNIYNISDLRTQLANTSSASVNLELPISVGRLSQNTSASRSLLSLKDIEKPAFHSTIVGQDLKTISEVAEINFAAASFSELQEPVKEPEKQKNHRARHSIGDLVDRYKKIRDQSITLPHIGFDDDD